MTASEQISFIFAVFSLIVSCFSLYFSLKRINPYVEDNKPIILPNNKVLIKKGTKITKIQTISPGWDVVEWSYRD